MWRTIGVIQAGIGGGCWGCSAGEQMSGWDPGQRAGQCLPLAAAPEDQSQGQQAARHAHSCSTLACGARQGERGKEAVPAYRHT